MPIVKNSTLTTKGMFVKYFKIKPSSLVNQFNSRNYFGDDPIFLLIQGSGKFCNDTGDKIKKCLRRGHEINLVLAGNMRGGTVKLRRNWLDHPADLNWTALNHNMVGGSTISVWVLGSSLHLNKSNMLMRDEIKRSIGDHMSSIDNGVVIDSLDFE